MRSIRDSVVLVTGGAGSVGSNLVQHLLGMDVAEVVVVDDLSSAARWNVPASPRVNFIEGSIVDEGTLRDGFARRPSFVFHVAALFANQRSIEQPEQDLLTNGMGTLKVLEHAQRSGVERVVYTSSGGSVYNCHAPLPFVEEDVSIELETPYQITKLLGEMYCHFFHRYHRLDTVRVRLFNSFGPGEVPGRFRNVVPNFVYWALSGRPLPITGTGEETRDFTYVGDVVRGLVAAATTDEARGHVYNLSAGRETPILEVARLVNELTGNRAGIERRERRDWDKKGRSVASSEKARRQLQFQAVTGIEEGLAETVRWFRDHWSSIQRDARF